jgi:hypothetical protein
MVRLRLIPAVLVLVLSMPATVAASFPPVRCYPIADFYDVATGPTLIGDIDGDHTPDTVRTRAAWTSDQTCRAWLIVDTGDTRYRRQIEPPGILIGPPPVAALVRLANRPGLAIAIVPWKGAAMRFVDVYAIHRHRLLKLNDSLFAYAGSIVNRAGVDCVAHRGANLVSSTATYNLTDDHYHVRRVFYALRAAGLELLPRLTERHRVRPAGLTRFPELGAYVPFPRCTAVIGLI